MRASLARSGLVLGGVCLNLLVALVLGEMIARNLLGLSWSFTLDLGGWLMVGIVFLSLAAVLRRQAHIRLTLLIDRAPPQLRRRIGLLASAVSLAFALFFAASAGQNLAFVFEMGITAPTALDVPVWPLWLIVTLGLVLFCVELGLDLLAAWRGALSATAEGQAPGSGTL